MSFIKKALASVGIGAAQVDAVLDRDRACPGDEITGTIHIRGGDTAQTIDYIGMALMTQYKREVDEGEVYISHPLSQTKVREVFEVSAGETLELPFSLQVPWETPLALGRTQVWVQTSLAVSMALDPKDRDTLHIDPTEGMVTVLQALKQLGFTLRKADCEENRRMGRGVPFIQEFEFMPGGTYAGRLTELEVIMAADPSGVQLWLEVDLRTRGLVGMLLGEFDLNERLTQVHLDQATLNQGTAAVASRLGQVIDTRIS